jgi:CRISPR-associated protein Cmr6
VSGNYEIPIPSKSAEAFHAYKGVTNPGLVFDRFAPDWSSKSTLKKEGLQRVTKAQADEALLREWNARWERCVRAARGEPFTLQTDWRFVAGLGRKGSLEVGFTFHRYGFPILPGSSVKGVARAWAFLWLAEQANVNPLAELDEVLSADGEDDEKEEKKKYLRWRAAQPDEVQQLADDFRVIFGTPATAGRAVFFDAIPANPPKLELDVMNPHFPEYYKGNAPPTDWQSPVPVYFLTVAAGTEFRFGVGWRGTLDEVGQRLHQLAQEWLTEGLINLGAGAKTSAGYGYFVAPPQPKLLESSSAGQARAASAVAELPPESLTWRTGIVKEYRPDRHMGRLVDKQTGEELSFQQAAIEKKDWSPARKQEVQYAYVEEAGRRRVVKVRPMTIF